jgi:hypothetical protein
MGSWANEVPEGCDCCGRDAEDCGIPEDGWVSDSELVADGAVFCRRCAHLLRIARQPEWCAWCGGLMVDEERADALGWAYFLDEVGDMHACCPGCLAERFGIAGRVRQREADQG